MAGNKINTKKKDDKSKSSRTTDQTIEETEDIDFSLLRKPVPTSVTGFAQARKIFDLATEELQGLLSNECDLLYECKVCRNLFRSLANFISHKRVYCKEKFNSSTHSHFLKEVSLANEVLKIRKLEESYQESLNEKIETDAIEDDDTRIPITKDLTSIVEMITKNKSNQQSELENTQLVFQKIPKSSVAVFQNIESSDAKSDTMKAQVSELKNILSQENAVLQSDGTFNVQSSDKVTQSTDTVIQISDDDEKEESDILKCKICDLQFSTLKTLKFHIKYKHLENRLVYPCPDCLDIFSTSWSVYRHLFKVHRKTAAQIRRLRESIQAKAFRMNNPPAFYEKRKTAPKVAPTQKITEEERLYKENQAWLEELDGESEGRRCGGCGRTFERRAALQAHTHTCARRHRRRIQIQIRKDYNKEPNNPYLAMAGGASATTTDTKANTEEIQTSDKVVEEKDNEETPLTEAELSIVDNKNKTEESELMEIDETVIQSEKKFYESTMINKLPYAQQIEKNNLNAFKQKIQLEIDIDSRLCKKCDNKYDGLNELLEHMAGHYKWVRYACKLCNYKHFQFEKLPEHVKIVHKLKGNTDFYCSTVKAVDGAEALELSETVDDVTEVAETSPDSRRPSRCSSDSSRLSDDSSSSSTRVETGSRKRKSNLYKNNAKRKKEVLIADDNDHKEATPLKDSVLGETNAVQSSKIFEENSSDLDDIDEKTFKRQTIKMISSVASRRPIRKRTKPKNADFEYDLSNLLKMEAQGYRDSQTVCYKGIQGKKKVQQDIQNNYEIINKDCLGAMITLSRKSVENAQGHMKTASFPIFKSSKESRISSIFARPMIPKVTRVEKISPKKVGTDEINDTSSPSKKTESSNLPNITKELTLNKNTITQSEQEESDISTESTKNATIIKTLQDTSENKQVNAKPSQDSSKTLQDPIITSQDTVKAPSNIIEVPQDTIKTSQDAIIGSQDAIKGSQDAIKGSQDAIKGSQDLNKVNTITGSGDPGTVNVPQDIIKVKSIDTILSELNKERPLSSTDKDNRLVLENNERSTPLVTETETVSERVSSEVPKTNLNLVPLKLRRQSMDIMKNPIIKKNITDFTKAGMKAKILVIKPINRNADGSQNLNAPIKFQTIKLKDPNKSSGSNDEKKSDQVVVVKMPKVDCTINRPVSTNSIVKNLKSCPVNSESTLVSVNEKSETDSSSINETTTNGDKSAVIKHDQENLSKKDNQINFQSLSSTSEPVNIVNEVIVDSNKKDS